MGDSCPERSPSLKRRLCEDSGFSSTPDSSCPEQSPSLKRRAIDNAGHSTDDPVKVLTYMKPVLYGKLFVLGYNGCIPPGNRGRVRSKYSVIKKFHANGVKFATSFEASKLETLRQARFISGKPTIVYKYSINRSVMELYARDTTTDMFQIGRSGEPPIDFVVLDTARLAGRTIRNTVSRFACRIAADRINCNEVRLYAAGFDEDCCIFLSDNAIKWQDGDRIDSLTTNGVLLCHPIGEFWRGDAKPGPWRELSVGGKIYTQRTPRQSDERGELVPDETNVLKDGSLIDLCGATLLWRSREGLQKSLTKAKLLADYKEMKETSNFDNWIPIYRRKVPAEEEKVPFVHLNCGHVQSYGHTDSDSSRCPECQEDGPIAKLCLGQVRGFYVDNGPLVYAFNPCGHVANKKTVMYWSSVKIPTRNNTSESVCPFCATALSTPNSYVRLQNVKLPSS